MSFLDKMSIASGGESSFDGKGLCLAQKYIYSLNINFPASIATDSGLKGESPLAISSAFTNSLQSNKSGSTEYEAVVFPAPLQPAIIYRI